MRNTIFFCLIMILTAVFAFAEAPKSHWAMLDGNKIHYYDIGNEKNKNALIFVHGWTCNADFWKDSYSAFPSYRVIAVDLIGHGKSDKPKALYSMEYFAKSVEAVMRNAKVQKAVFVGHSMGTPVARQFYRLYPDKTVGIVIVDGALRSFFPKDAMEQFIAPLRTNYKENAAKFVEGMLTPIKDESLKRTIRESMAATPDYVAISAMEGMADEKIWTDDKINIPVLAVMAPSQFWPPDVKDVFTSLAPKIDFQMWTGVSHFLMMEKPKEFNEQVSLFVAKNKLL
ncbi:MAG: alpha/beta hydrolase [Pyrinomonadaceae bacterium]